MATQQPTAYCYGMIAPSTLYLLDSPYPQANAYAEIAATYENLAGEALAGAWVLQRLGIQTKLEGRWLTDSYRSVELLQKLDFAGIDVSRLKIEPGYHPQEEVVLADGKTRTVFGGYTKILFQEKQWSSPREDDIANAGIVLLDPFLGAESEACASLCVTHKVPIVTCDVAPEHFIAKHAFCNIISEEFLLREKQKLLQTAAGLGIIANRKSTWETLFGLYTTLCEGWVIFTFGGEPLWYAMPAELGSTRTRAEFHPFPIQVKDSTGAGDSFRAGFAFAHLQGMQGSTLVRTASAIAGLVCERFPGVLESPSRKELDAFLQNASELS